MKYGYFPVTSEISADSKIRQHIIDAHESLFQQTGGKQLDEQMLKANVPLLYFILTGGTENILLELHARRQSYFPGESAVLLAHPGNNSLPAALEILARLQQDGIKGQIVFLGGADIVQKLETTVHDIETARSLRQSRIGLIGAPSDWLVASSPDPELLQTQWGPEIVTLAMDELKQALRNIQSDEIESLSTSLVHNANEIREPSQAELSDAVRVYLALKQLVSTHHLDALSLRCFDLVLDLKTTGCFGLSQLTDEGVIAGCEGDLVSTLGMLWAYRLLGETPWMANPARIDEKKNKLWLAHCTIPRNLIQKYNLRSHFESGLGVGIQGFLEPDVVTLIRIGGKNMDELWLAEGEIIQSGQAENLCRTQVEIQLIPEVSAGDLLKHPLGNHLVLVKGHHRQRFKTWHTAWIR